MPNDNYDPKVLTETQNGGYYQKITQLEAEIERLRVERDELLNMNQQYVVMVQAEREACAEVAENWDGYGDAKAWIAAAIRGRKD